VAVPRDAPTGECDLAVAVDPDAASLCSAWTLLRAGGAFYGEWRSPLHSTPDRIRQQLRTAGFERVVCYRTWPRPSNARCWVPLAGAGALRYLLVTGRPGGYPVLSAVAGGFRRLASHPRLFDFLPLPICAIATKPPAGPPAGPPDELETLIRADWDAWGLGAPPARLSYALLTPGLRSINKVVELVFSETHSSPVLAIKRPRVGECIPAIEREAAVLGAVHATRPGGLSGVPRVLFCREVGGVLTLGETVVSGQPLHLLLKTRGYPALAHAATDWLIGLAGQPRTSPRSVWWDRLVASVLVDFTASFGGVARPAMLDETVRALERLDGLPLVCEHRDFSPWNVLMRPSGDLAVLDWESAEPEGLPLLDLVYFLTYLAFFQCGAMKSGRFRGAYRASLDPSTPIGRVVSTCLRRYVEAIDLDPAAVQPLRMLTWLVHARSEHRRLAADAGGTPSPEALRRSLFLSLWRMELSASRAR
jgi:hypothetical protein